MNDDIKHLLLLNKINISYTINEKLYAIIEYKLTHLEGYPFEVVDAQ